MECGTQQNHSHQHAQWTEVLHVMGGTYYVGGQFDCFSGCDEFYTCINMHNNKVAHRTLGRIEVLP